MSSPDILIIGSGVVGSSIAWHLARAGAGSIAIIDRGSRPCTGSTSRATGGFRAQFGSGMNVRLSLLSREKLLRFDEEVGGTCGYTPAGYLFVASSDDEVAALNTAREVQRAAGFDEAVALDHDEVRAVAPWLAPDTFIGGSFSATDGFIDPVGIASGYLDAALRAGVELRCGVSCARIERRGDRIVAVHSSEGTLTPGIVINAGGAWANEIVRDSGVELPVTPLRRQVASTVPTDALGSRIPMTIYAGDGYHLRIRDGRALLLWPNRPDDPASDTFDPAWLAEVERKTRERVLPLADVAIDRNACWAGLYEMSPDSHAILGRMPGVENLFVANGSSGHGVMHAPALGQLISELVTEGAAKSLDIRPLRPSRFEEGEPITGSSLL